MCEGPAGGAEDCVGSVSPWGVSAGAAGACGVGGDGSLRTVRAVRSWWHVWAVRGTRPGPGWGTLGASAVGVGCGTPAAVTHLALRGAGCTARACVLPLRTPGCEGRGSRSAPSHSPGAQHPSLASPLSRCWVSADSSTSGRPLLPAASAPTGGARLPEAGRGRPGGGGGARVRPCL